MHVTIDGAPEPLSFTCDTTAVKAAMTFLLSHLPAGPLIVTDLPFGASARTLSILGIILGCGMRAPLLWGHACNRAFQTDAADSISLPPIGVKGGLTRLAGAIGIPRKGVDMGEILERARVVVQIVGCLGKGDGVARQPLRLARPALFREH